MPVWAAWHLAPHFWPERAVHLATQPSTKGHCDAIEPKLNEMSQGKLPVKEGQGKVMFHQEVKKGAAKPPPKTQVVDETWRGIWRVAADLDLDGPFVFPVVTTSERPDLVVWSDGARRVILLELTVPWKENFGIPEDRRCRGDAEM